ncbi:MAG: hypothetical protein M3Y59_11175 [Myxococcota bacterium]|nr:hypothetical protein [Myxococcota bacterium]
MRALLLLGCLALGGCMKATLPTLGPSTPIAPVPGKVILAGHLQVIPPLTQQEEGAPRALLLSDLNGKFYAIFSPTLRERYSRSAFPPLQDHHSAWVPMEGPFFIEVPADRPLYLRGLILTTNAGRRDLEVPLRLDLRAQDQVVYAGHWTVVRGATQKVLVKDRREQMERFAKSLQGGALLQRRWVTRLASAVDGRDEKTTIAAVQR